MSRLVTKPKKWHVRPAKTQIRPVWSESSLCAQWVAKDLSFLHADSEVADAQVDLSLRWAHKPFCWFFHEAAQISHFSRVCACDTPVCLNKRYTRIRPVLVEKFGYFSFFCKQLDIFSFFFFFFFFFFIYFSLLERLPQRWQFFCSDHTCPLNVYRTQEVLKIEISCTTFGQPVFYKNIVDIL